MTTQTYHLISARHRRADDPADFHTVTSRETEKDGRTTERKSVKDNKIKTRLNALHSDHITAVQTRHPDQPIEVIAEDITIEDGTARGILNCRVNGQHVQHRFSNA